MQKGSKAGLAGRRFLSWLIDLLLFSVIAIFTGIYFTQESTMISIGMGYIGKITNIILLLGIALPAVYLFMSWVFFGATIGMKALGLRVKSIHTNKKLNPGVAILRFLMWIVNWFSFPIGFLWMLCDSRGQTFADKLSSTVIVRKGDYKEEVPPSSERDRKVWLVGAILSVFGMILASSTIFLFLYQPRLNPGISNTLYSYLPGDNPEENSFYELYGFTAPQGIDPYDAGLQKVVNANKTLLDYNATNVPISDPRLKKLVSTFKDTLRSDIHYVKDRAEGQSNIDLIKSKRKELRPIIEKYQYMKERYSRIREYKYFKTKIIPHTASPYWRGSLLVAYQRLVSAEFVLEYLYGDRNKALELMQLSYDVNRNLFKVCDDMLIKYMTAYNLGNVEEIISELMSYEKPCDQRLLNFVSNVQGFDREDVNLRKPRETGFNYTLISTLADRMNNRQILEDYVVTPKEITQSSSFMFKSNDFANQFYAFNEYIMDYSEKSFPEIYAEKDNRFSYNPTSVLNVFNTLGVAHTITVIHVEKMAKDYLFRYIHNYLGTKLLKAKADIIRENVPKDKIEDFLQNDVVKYGVEYKDETFKYDSVNHKIYFDQLNKDESYGFKL